MNVPVLIGAAGVTLKWQTQRGANVLVSLMLNPTQPQ